MAPDPKRRRNEETNASANATDKPQSAAEARTNLERDVAVSGAEGRIETYEQGGRQPDSLPSATNTDEIPASAERSAGAPTARDGP